MNLGKLIEIYCAVDDFYIEMAPEIQNLRLLDPNRRIRKRKSKLSDPEMMSILICFHLSHYTNFKAFYCEYVCRHWSDHFPDLVSYERFNQTQYRVLIPMIVFLKTNCVGYSRGINFIDSTTLKVCHIKRRGSTEF